jgi:hypothetical protein
LKLSGISYSREGLKVLSREYGTVIRQKCRTLILSKVGVKKIVGWIAVQIEHKFLQMGSVSVRKLGKAKVAIKRIGRFPYDSRGSSIICILE